MTRLATAEALERALAKGLAPIHWVAGDEMLLVLEATDRIRARARELGFAERVVLEVGQHFDVSLLVGQTQAMSLFGERRLVDVRLAGKPAKEFGETLARIVPTLGDDTRLLVTGGKLDKTTSASAWFGAIDKAGVCVELPRIERDQFPAWIAARLARQDQRADAATVQLIADRTEGNLLAAHQEIRRLALLAPPGQLQADAVDAIIVDSARFEVFALIDTAMDGQTGRALRMLDGLKAEDAPLPLLSWGLADGLRRLAKVFGAMESGQPLASALRGAGVFGRREPPYRRAVGRLDRPAVLRLLRQTARLDRMAKGVGSAEGGPADPWAAAERVVIGLSGIAPLREPV